MNARSELADAAMVAEPTGLNVRLRFEIGRLDVPIDLLDGVQAGYTFLLPIEDRMVAKIYIGETTIGVGQVVSVDGRVGVHVTSLKTKDCSHA